MAAGLASPVLQNSTKFDTIFDFSKTPDPYGPAFPSVAPTSYMKPIAS
jgi:hypothetical protein